MLKYPLFDMSSGGRDWVKIKAPWPIGVQHVAMQGSWVTLWAISDDTLPLRDRTFFLCATGQLIEGEKSYIGTAHDGALVWHIFEEFSEAS